MEQIKQNEIVNYTRSQSSFKFRWGKTGDEATIYFDNEEDLMKQIAIIEKAIQEADRIKAGFSS